jgi:acyl phosphate:glycerol-3-phosphate acyltransferase
MGVMNIFILLLVLLGSYLLGSISFARVITKIWSGKDVTEFEVPLQGEEESNKVISVGANAVSSELGTMAGMLVSVLDIMKITVLVILVRRFFPDNTWLHVLAAVGGMVGHNWPIYYRFHGGAGYSTIVGAMLVFDPLAVLVTPLIGVFLGVVVFHNYLIATVSWMWLLIPWLWLRRSGQIEYIFYAFAVNIIFWLAMIPEVKMAIKNKNYTSSNRASTPMGRGYMKMARAMGFNFDDQQEEENTTDSAG